MDRQTKIAISIFVLAVVLIMMLAAYGYFSGSWEVEP